MTQTTFVLTAQTFRSLVDQVIYAAHSEKTRYAMNCVMVEVYPEEGHCRVTATDGKRLARAWTWEQAAPTSKPVTLYLERGALLGQLPKLYPLRSHANKVAEVTLENLKDLPQVGGLYPPVEDVIPKEAGGTLVWDGIEHGDYWVRSGEDPVGYLSANYSEAVACHQLLKGNGQRYPWRILGLGAPDEPYEIRVGLNLHYLADMPPGRLEIGDGKKPVAVRQRSSLHLLMPLNMED